MYITILVKQEYWYISQVSGERLQDHWSSGFLLVQANLIIMLSLGSMKTDRVISEPCYNEVIYNRHIAK